ELRIEHLFQCIDAQQPTDEIAVIAEIDDGGFFVFVLVGDLTHDLLDDVFDGDDAGRAAVLVYDDRDLQMLALEFAQQIADLLRLGDEVRRPRELGDGARLPFQDRVEDLLHVNDSCDLIDRLGVDRNAGVLRLAEHPRDLIERLARVERLHVDARRHQLLRHAIAEVDDRLQQLPFGCLENALFLANVDVGLHFFVRDLFVIVFVGHVALLLDAVEKLAQRKEHRPEDVIEEMGQRNQPQQQLLAQILGEKREDELPDHDDDDPDRGGAEKRLDQRSLVLEHDQRGAECEDEGDLQQRAADQLEIARIVNAPSAALLRLAPRQAPEGHGTELLHECTDGVENQKQDSAERGKDDPDGL